MKKAIMVQNKGEGAAIEKGLENPVTRAIVVVEGVLSELTSAQQDRVLTYVEGALKETNDNKDG